MDTKIANVIFINNQYIVSRVSRDEMRIYTVRGDLICEFNLAALKPTPLIMDVMFYSCGYIGLMCIGKSSNHVIDVYTLKKGVQEHIVFDETINSLCVYTSLRENGSIEEVRCNLRKIITDGKSIYCCDYEVYSGYMDILHDGKCIKRLTGMEGSGKLQVAEAHSGCYFICAGGNTYKTTSSGSVCLDEISDMKYLDYCQKLLCFDVNKHVMKLIDPKDNNIHEMKTKHVIWKPCGGDWKIDIDMNMIISRGGFVINISDAAPKKPSMQTSVYVYTYDGYYVVRHDWCVVCLAPGKQLHIGRNMRGQRSINKYVDVGFNFFFI